MEEANERETPVTVNVKALANFFQSLSRQDSGKACDLVVAGASWSKPSPSYPASLPAEQVGLPPVTTCTSTSPSPSLSSSDSTKRQEHHEEKPCETEEHKQTPPVPLPRISLIRKQTAYGSSSKNSDQSIYCDIINTSHEDDCFSNDDIEEEDEEDIYEEIPDSYYSSHPELQCATRQQNSFKSEPINRKLSQSLQKIKIVLQRSLGDDSRRKASLFQFKSRDSKDRKLPKPPSVEQLERPFRSSSQYIYQNKCNDTQRQHSEYYYDVQEVNSCTGSDDYYLCIDDEELQDDTEQDEEDGYEEIIHPVSPEVPESVKSTYDGSVQYAEIDPVQTRELERRIEKEQKRLERRQREQAEKWRRKFGLTGQEVPVNYGTVKADVGRSRSNRLRVKKGETVLVLRMEGNPPGLYLAKNERSEVGYVELCNIEFDPESIKAIMRVETEVGAS